MSTLRRWWHTVTWYIGSVMGDRDYEHYVGYMRRRRPGTPIPDEREFWRRRYGDMSVDPSSRCC